MSINQLKYQLKLLDDKLLDVANWYKFEYNNLQQMIDEDTASEEQLRPIIYRLKRCEKNTRQIVNENKKLLSEVGKWIKPV